MKNKKIIIIGESHTRQFALRRGVVPLFAGNGKNINLDNPDIVQEKINSVTKTKKYNFEKKTFLYIGEPNCRIKLRGHWTPHWDELRCGIKVKSKVDKNYLNECVSKYKELDLRGIDYLITPTCAYDPVVPSLIYFNDLLKSEFKTKVIDIFSHTYDDSMKVKEDFKAKDWLKDPIHLNSKASDIFFSELKDRNIIEDVTSYLPEIEGHFGTHIIFEKDRTKFGTYVL